MIQLQVQKEQQQQNDVPNNFFQTTKSCDVNDKNKLFLVMVHTKLLTYMHCITWET